MHRRARAAVLVAAGLGVFGWVGPAGGQEAAGLREVIRASADSLLRAPAERPGAGDLGSCGRAVVRLLDAAAEISRAGSLSGPFGERIASAAAVATKESFLSDGTLHEIQRAYEALNGGRTFTVPASVTDMDSVIAFGRERISRTLAALDAGRHEEAARELLDFIVMVVTPMEAR